MTRDYIIKRIEIAIIKNFKIMQLELPVKTGRLRMRSFKLERTAQGWKLYIDLQIAPYAIYLDSKRKTAGWWTIATLNFMRRLTLDLQGVTNVGFA